MGARMTGMSSVKGPMDMGRMSVTRLPKKQARALSAFGETGKHVAVMALKAPKGY